MLSDEEKEAIEYFKSNLEMTKEMGKKWGFQEEIKNNETILNLIEKQSKEIEELKEGFKIQEHNYQVAMEEIEQRWEDKIKAKIEEYKESGSVDGTCDELIYEMQTLLEKE